LTAVSLSDKLLVPLRKFHRLSILVEHLEKIQKSFHLVKGDKGLFAKALLLSLVYHVLTIFNTVAAGYAVGWFDPPIAKLFVVVPLILLVSALPLAPNSLGIQEGAFYFFLHSVGATPEQALGLALVLRVKSYALALLGWMVWLRAKKLVPVTPHSPS
ncbi:MAG: flippase-like domain-containing protein, partial [Bdellovibrionales bacterium]|nr:flippase-like domain-containing protein [Bdellovibrionales bacterium]